MTRNYIDIVNEISAAVDKDAKPYVTTALVCEFEERISKNIPMEGLREKHSVPKPYFKSILDMLFKRLLSKEQRMSYFLSCLKNMYGDKSTWEIPKVKEDFARIVGYHVPRKGDIDRKNEFYGVFYRDKSEYYYPAEVISVTLECIERVESLDRACKSLQELYKHRPAPIFRFLSEFIVSRIGESKMSEYFKKRVQKYISTLSYYDEGSLIRSDMVHWVFGKYYKDGCFSGGYNAKRAPETRMIKRIFLRATFEFGYKNYLGSESAIYDAMGLTDAEKEEYHRKFYGKRFDNRNRHPLRMYAPCDMSLPNGTSLEYIMGLIRTELDKYSEKRLLPNKENLLVEIKRNLPTGPVKGDIKYILNCNSVRRTVIQILDQWLGELRSGYKKTNTQALMEHDDCWLYFFHGNRERSIHIDMQNLSLSFRKEIRIYAQECDDLTYTNAAHINRQIDFARYAMTHYRVSRCIDVKVWHIRAYVKYLENTKKLKPMSQSQYVSSIRLLIESVMRCEEYDSRPTENVADRIVFINLKGHISRKGVMPDDTYQFLQQHIDELPKKTALMYKIQCETGFRFSDVVSITVDDVNALDGDDQYAKIASSVPKTRGSRHKAGYDDLCEDYITRELYAQIIQYIEETEPIRRQYKTNLLFFDIWNGSVNPPSVAWYNQQINELIKQHGFISSDETYTSFVSGHPRKKVATVLINADVPLEAVQRKLNHTNPMTTALYYAEVQKNRLADKNSQFFKERFELSITPERLKFFTKNEREALYEDFLLGRRDVPLGVCGRHVSEGRCADMSDGECETCTAFCTGKKFLTQWRDELKKTNERIKSFEAAYLKAGISAEDYQDFPEYREEIDRRTRIEDLIAKIEES